MNKLIKLEKISIPNVKVLRSLYDSIISNVRVFNAVGIESANFGPLLIPTGFRKTTECYSIINKSKVEK